MTRLEDLKPGLQLQGIVPQQLVTIVDVKWHGTAAVELAYTYRVPIKGLFKPIL
jgi:hypothetical protein